MIDPLVIRQEQRSYETGMFQITSDNDDDDIDANDDDDIDANDDAYDDDNTNDDCNDDDVVHADGRCVHHAPGPHLA